MEGAHFGGEFFPGGEGRWDVLKNWEEVNWGVGAGFEGVFPKVLDYDRYVDLSVVVMPMICRGTRRTMEECFSLRCIESRRTPSEQDRHDHGGRVAANGSVPSLGVVYKIVHELSSLCLLDWKMLHACLRSQDLMCTATKRSPVVRYPEASGDWLDFSCRTSNTAA